MDENPLQTPVQYLRGCGPDRAALLHKLGVFTASDLLWYLPRDVLDLTKITAPQNLRAGEMQTVRGTVVDRDARSLSHGRSLVGVLLDSNGEFVRGTWFNQPWMLQKFANGNVVLFSGKPKRHGGRWEFNNPRVQWLHDEDGTEAGEVVPRYGLTEGLTLDALRRLIQSAVEDHVEAIPDPLPEGFHDKLKLPHLREAVRNVHRPASKEDYETARHRLLFDDLFEFQLGLALRRRLWRKSEQAPELPTTAKIDARIRRLFPFAFTGGQDAAVKDIAADLACGQAMHRLLQADVGAGKTAVALYAMLVAIAAGYQAVLMAPTEVLASQHWATVDEALANSRVKRVLLTGNLTAKQRRQALDDIRAGATQLIVGTQAVIQQDVVFPKLGVAVIDEQHKFGVMQRSRFSGADGVAAHVLVMTATPIPRSLCLTQFGDLDITTISELPPGRQRIVTSRVTGPKPRAKAWDFIRKQLQAGRQAYVVCPRVSSSDDANSPDDPFLDAALEGELSASAEDVHEQLRTGELRDFNVGLVHGQLDRHAKAAAMESFRDGETHVLVATTVVEVGVDVPNATIMVINQAERFGLSQLHQLRGRIGRGKFQSYCFLFSESDSEEAKARLAAMEETSDGFKIAEADFELRGPGDVLGVRQHGRMPLRVADLRRDQKILRHARKIAFGLVESGEFDEPAFAATKRQVLKRFHEALDLPQTG